MSQQGEDSVLTALETVNTSLTLIQRRIGNIETRLSSVQSEVEAKIEELGPYLHQINEKSRTNNFQVLTGVDLGFINRTIQKLILAQTQEQILEVHLKETQRYIKRGILFLEQETKYLPWKSIGFESESIEEVVAVDLEDPIIRAARQKRIIYRVDASAELFPWLKRMGEIPHSCICIPFAFEDFVPIVFYGDSFETIPIDTLELLTHLTVLVLKNNYLQSVGKDKASLAQQSWIQGGEREKHLTRPVPVLETESEPTLPQKGDQALTVLEEAVAQLEKELETSPSWSGLKKPDTQLEVKAQSEEDQPKVSFKKSYSGELSPGVGEKTKDQMSQKTEDPSLENRARSNLKRLDIQDEPQARLGQAEETGSVEMATIEPELLALTSEQEEKYHREAQRFARLLISEIALYQEEKIQQGQENGDIYDRLQEDIDKTRKMYEKRCHPIISSEVDHLHEQMIEILAGGDETLLGNHYPGPHCQDLKSETQNTKRIQPTDNSNR